MVRNSPIALTVAPYRLTLRQPLRTAVGPITDRQGLVVQVRTPQGRGWGEAAPLPGFSPDTLADTAHTLTQAAIAWVGQPLPPLAALPERLAPYHGAARHGLELALLNAIAAVEGVSLAQLLAAESGPPTAVPCNGTIGLLPPPQAAQRAIALVQAGFRCLKVKGEAQGNRERLAAIRQAVGPHIPLRLDLNGAWTLAEALNQLPHLAPFRLEYLEQPVRGLTNLQTLRRHAQPYGLAIAADEDAHSLAAIEALLAAAAVDVVVLKPMILGGLLPTREAIHRIQQHGGRYVVTTTLEGAIARHGALALAAACPAGRLPCGLATGAFLTVDFPGGEEWCQGIGDHGLEG